MRKVLIFGNSGSGKSTLAKELAQAESLAHLDLDTLAWLPTNPPTRSSLDSSQKKIVAFMESHDGWVIEGCYADLLELASSQATEIIFLNLPIEQCIENAKSRPWEPHKYESPEAQDKNLDMLIGWIEEYQVRNDTFSHTAHLKFYENFHGSKTMYTGNNRP